MELGKGLFPDPYVLLLNFDFSFLFECLTFSSNGRGICFLRGDHKHGRDGSDGIRRNDTEVHTHATLSSALAFSHLPLHVHNHSTISMSSFFAPYSAPSQCFQLPLHFSIFHPRPGSLQEHPSSPP